MYGLKFTFTTESLKFTSISNESFLHFTFNFFLFTHFGVQTGGRADLDLRYSDLQKHNAALQSTDAAEQTGRAAWLENSR